MTRSAAMLRPVESQLSTISPVHSKRGVTARIFVAALIVTVVAPSISTGCPFAFTMIPPDAVR
jgi:hypothetical protein